MKKILTLKTKFITEVNLRPVVAVLEQLIRDDAEYGEHGNVGERPHDNNEKGDITVRHNGGVMERT